jgi:DNA-binding GntR family transcriptional regulator
MPTTRHRLPYGQLTPLILNHLRTYPHLTFTPWELAKVLGHSHGAIRRTLLRLADDGTVDQTSRHPARFQHHR